MDLRQQQQQQAEEEVVAVTAVAAVAPPPRPPQQQHHHHPHHHHHQWQQQQQQHQQIQQQILPKWLREFVDRLQKGDTTLKQFVVPQRLGHSNNMSQLSAEPMNRTMMNVLVESLLLNNNNGNRSNSNDDEGEGENGSTNSNNSSNNNYIEMMCLSGCVSKDPSAIIPFVERILLPNNCSSSSSTIIPHHPSSSSGTIINTSSTSPSSIMSNLTTLSLSSNNLQDSHAVLIGKSLSLNTTLQELYLSSNQIGDVGATAIAQGIENCGCGYCGSTTTTSLSSSSSNKSNLEVITLSWNNIGEKGCLAISQMLQTNTSLIRIDLLGNYNITQNGAMALSQVLQTVNYSLEELWMSPANYHTSINLQYDYIAQYCKINRKAKQVYQKLSMVHDNNVNNVNNVQEGGGNAAEAVAPAAGTAADEATMMIPYGLWPEAMGLMSPKPDLVYQILQMKAPVLCKDSPGTPNYYESTANKKARM